MSEETKRVRSPFSHINPKEGFSPKSKVKKRNVTKKTKSITANKLSDWFLKDEKNYASALIALNENGSRGCAPMIILAEVADVKLNQATRTALRYVLGEIIRNKYGTMQSNWPQVRRVCLTAKAQRFIKDVTGKDIVLK